MFIRQSLMSVPKSPPIVDIQKFVFTSPKVSKLDFYHVPLEEDIPIQVSFGTFGQIMEDTIQHYGIGKEVTFQEFVKLIKDFGVQFPDLNRVIDSYDVFTIRKKKFVPRILRPLRRPVSDAKQEDLEHKLNVSLAEQEKLNGHFITAYPYILRELELVDSFRDIYNLFLSQNIVAQLPVIRKLLQFISGLFNSDAYVGIQQEGEFRLLNAILDDYISKQVAISKDTDEDLEKIVHDVTSSVFTGKKLEVERSVLSNAVERILVLDSIYKQFVPIFTQTIYNLMSEDKIPFVVYVLNHLPFDKIGFYFPEQFDLKDFQRAQFPVVADNIAILSSDDDKPEEAKDYFRLLLVSNGITSQLALQLENDLFALLSYDVKESIYEQIAVPPYNLFKDVKSDIDRFYLQNKKKILISIAQQLNLLDDQRKLTRVGEQFVNTKKTLKSLFFTLSDLNGYYMHEANILKNKLLSVLKASPMNVKHSLVLGIKQSRFVFQHGAELEKGEQTESAIQVRPVNIIQFLSSVMRDRFIVYRLTQSSNKLFELKALGEVQPEILDLIEKVETQSNELIRKLKQIVIKDEDKRQELFNIIQQNIDRLLDFVDQFFKAKKVDINVVGDVRAMKLTDLFKKLHIGLVTIITKFGKYLAIAVTKAAIGGIVDIPDTVDAIKFGMIVKYPVKESLSNILLKKNLRMKI